MCMPARGPGHGESPFQSSPALESPPAHVCTLRPAFSRSPTSVCRREAAPLQALLAVQHVSEPCALSLLQPCGGQQPSATSQLACSLAQRVRRSLSCAFVQLLLSLSHPRPASALRCGGNPPLRLVTFALRGRLLLLPACSGRSCLPPTCGCGKSPTALGYSHAVGVGESGHELGSTAARPAATAWRAACRG